MPPPLVALVTAGTAGLGAATARLFARSGMRVVINYATNSTRATSLLTELQSLSPLPASPSSSPPNFLSIKADLAVRGSIVALVDEAVKKMGRLDVVFSNGGWTQMRDFMNLDENVEEADWDRCWNVNVKAHLWLMHAAKSHLEETEGVFITTASLAGVKPSGSSLAYSVTKAAQIHLVKGLAVIAAPKIRVNSVSPGILLTEWGLSFPQDRRDAALAQTKLKKFASVEDVAAQVLCYVNSKTVTGVNAVIDAGLSI